ncbi:MAG: toxin-antitoxin system YwqK family antitoxin [Flavobacteriales bacterium]
MQPTQKFLIQKKVNSGYVGLMVFYFLLCSITSSAQDFKIPKQRIPIINHGFRTLVQVYDGEKTVKRPDNERMYFWLKAKEVHATKGGYEGDLLHGDYTVFYPSESLKEKGRFEMGLKTGTWKEWYDNGQLKEISRWKNGQLSGEVKQFDDSGKLVTRNQYNRGFLNGRQFYYTDSVTIEKKYSNGKEILPKPKKKRGKKKKEIIEEETPVTTTEESTEPKKEKKKWKLFKKKEKKPEEEKPKEKKQPKKTDKTEKV